MTTLVTGATGFLGRHLVELLLKRDEVVRALVRSHHDAEELGARDVAYGLVALGARGCRRDCHFGGRFDRRFQCAGTIAALIALCSWFFERE